MFNFIKTTKQLILFLLVCLTAIVTIMFLSTLYCGNKVYSQWDVSRGILSLFGFAEIDSTGIANNKIMKYNSAQGKFTMQDDVSGAAGDSSFNFVAFIATDGDTNSIRSKTDKSLNLYAENIVRIGTIKADSMSYRNGVLTIMNDTPAANAKVILAKTTSADVFWADEDGDVRQAGNLYIQSDSTSAAFDIFVGNVTYSKMNAGDANFTTSSSADLKENFREIDLKDIDFSKIILYEYTWKKEAFGWKDVSGLPDSVTVFADVFDPVTGDTVTVAYKVRNDIKFLQLEKNEKIEKRCQRKQYGLKSSDFSTAFKEQKDLLEVDWQKLAVYMYKKVIDLETRVSKLEGN